MELTTRCTKEVAVDLHASAIMSSYINLAKKRKAAQPKKWTKIKYYVVEIL
jgi:hypothetical protein